MTLDDISVRPNTSEDGSCCAVPHSGLENQEIVVQLIERSVNQHFPKPPEELERNLQQHLLEVETVLQTQLERLAPQITCKELMGCLLECYHRQTFDHLHGLLQNISTSKNSFMLLNWVLYTYLRYLSTTFCICRYLFVFTCILIPLEVWMIGIKRETHYCSILMLVFLVLSQSRAAWCCFPWRSGYHKKCRPHAVHRVGDNSKGQTARKCAGKNTNLYSTTVTF